MSLRCKLVPVHYREYESGLLEVIKDSETNEEYIEWRQLQQMNSKETSK